MTATVQPILNPDRETMAAHLDHLFGGLSGEYAQGLVELSWTSATPVKRKNGSTGYLFHAEHFPISRIGDLIDTAATLNSTPGVNVYIGAAIRHPDTPPFGRADDRDAWALTALYVDLDDDGAAIRGKNIYGNDKPTWVTVTGNTPWLRGQLWWRLDQPLTDHTIWRDTLHGLSIAMHGDPTVCNPSRIMRLCGSVAWPHKEGRVMELTHKIELKAPGKSVYALDDLRALIPATAPKRVQSSPTSPQQDTPSGLGIGKLKDGRERYMRDTVLACLVEFVGMHGAAPTVDELFLAVWAQYSQRVDFSRPGRGPDEVRAKCATAIDRFSAGRIHGLETIDKAIGSYVAKNPLPEWEDDDEPLGEFDAGECADDVIPPRAWLLGNIFCRRYVSSIVADGAVGKTSLRYAQLLSLASGQELTGDKVFQRCRVLVVSLEDDANEVKRRLRAACLHHKLDQKSLTGWMYVATPGARGGRLMSVDKHGRAETGSLGGKIERVIAQRKIDIISLDPFVKTHAVEENNNSMIDEVIQILTDLAIKYDIAVDIPHHTSKGTADPGNANRARGASAMKDAARLVYSLSKMSEDEAKAFNLTEEERQSLVRMDSAKVNIAPPTAEARWFKLVSVNLGNKTDAYPAGDNVQAIEVWTPPDIWGEVSHAQIDAILDEIDRGLPDGNFYSDARSAKERGAWRVVAKHSPVGEGPARRMVATWVREGQLVRFHYTNPKTYKEVEGVRRGK